jgi:hypothetical protein
MLGPRGKRRGKFNISSLKRLKGKHLAAVQEPQSQCAGSLAAKDQPGIMAAFRVDGKVSDGMAPASGLTAMNLRVVPAMQEMNTEREFKLRSDVAVEIVRKRCFLVFQSPLDQLATEGKQVTG